MMQVINIPHDSDIVFWSMLGVLSLASALLAACGLYNLWCVYRALQILKRLPDRNMTSGARLGVAAPKIAYSALILVIGFGLAAATALKGFGEGFINIHLYDSSVGLEYRVGRRVIMLSKTEIESVSLHKTTPRLKWFILVRLVNHDEYKSVVTESYANSEILAEQYARLHKVLRKAAH